MQEPELKSQPNTTQTDDWSALRTAIKEIEAAGSECATAGYYLQIGNGNLNWRYYLDDVVELVPKLLDAYADLWEMSMAMTQAWEKLNESKNNLYVPDASEMVQDAMHKDR